MEEAEDGVLVGVRVRATCSGSVVVWEDFAESVCLCCCFVRRRRVDATTAAILIRDHVTAAAVVCSAGGGGEGGGERELLIFHEIRLESSRERK